MQCEATLLGRVPVDGAVDAGSLATLIRSLQHTPKKGQRLTEARRYLLRFNEVLEFVPRRTSPRRHDDEGFESDGDDDTASTRSVSSSADDTVSNSSSCCFVDDHVFKCHPTKGKTPSTSSDSGPSTNASSCVSSVATDSANSSGASDTDDLDTATSSPTALGASNSVNALVKSLSLFQQRKSSSKALPASSKTSNEKEESEDSRESYTVDEVAFCHTDPAFTRVVLWVVKKRQLQRLSPSGADTSSGLEAVVFECQREDLLKKLCESFQEKSRRAKLEKQYRHPHRRKDATSPALTPESIIKALKSSTISTDKVATLSHTPHVTVKPVLPKSSELDVLSTAKGTRFNLVQRTDGDGVTHIEVSRGLPLDIGEANDEDLCSGPSSIISISTPDIGNLLNSNNTKSRFCKEIEGVIRCDVDAGSPRREITQRQRQPAILVVQDDSGAELRKVWTPPVAEAEDPEPDVPPQRPERKRYTRKVKSPAPAPPPLDVATTLKRNNEQMVMRGQFIRVSVNQQQPVPLQSAWVYPRWAAQAPLKRGTLESHYQKNRSRNASSRSKSPPARRPMAYRYIDTVPNTTNTLSNRFFGLSQKLREITAPGSSLPYSATLTRRRNSLGELPARFEYLGESGGKNGNLKSVIKKSGGNSGRRLGECAEPKKVTFSAYATVQVVD